MKTSDRSHAARTGILRHPSILLPLLGTIALVAIAVIAPLVLTDDATSRDIAAAREGSSGEHLLGTDDLGRDVLARTLVASQLSLRLALIAAGFGFLAALPLAGAIAAGPRLVRTAVAQLIHIVIAFPGIVLALLVIAVTGVGTTGAVIAMAANMAPTFARVMSSSAVGVMSSDYIAAARLSGLARPRLFRRYVLPNVAEPLVVVWTLSVSHALVAFAALSFLGVGVQPPDTDWGRLLAEGLPRIYTTPIVVVGPALMILVAGIVLALVGDALAAIINPVTRAQLGDRRGRRREPAPDGARVALPPNAAGATESANGHRQVLHLEELTVVDRRRPHAPLVRDVSLAVAEREIVGLVGESGSGKTVAATAAARLLPPSLVAQAGRIVFEGEDLLEDMPRHRSLLALGMPIVFQDPMASLNPAVRVGTQMTEAVRTHQAAGRQASAGHAVERLRDVHIREPELVVRRYPFQLSGGMRQRVMIATALMATPRLVVADEVTTALDVTVQAEILRLLRELRDRWGTAVLFVSHDLTLVAQVCSRVVVMYAGEVVERGPTEQVMRHPRHPYTKALMACVPTLDTPRDQPLRTLEGTIPAPEDRPGGCVFAPRCPQATDHCRQERPTLETGDRDHRVACWLAEPAQAEAVRH